VLRSVPVDPARLTAYQHLVGEPAGDTLPPGFVHVLTFPVALSVMARADFPLPLAGMVHLHNHVYQRRSVRLGERLTVRVWAQDLRPHRRGTQVDLCSEVSADGESVWSGTATYLAKGVPGSRVPADPADGLTVRDGGAPDRRADEGREDATRDDGARPDHGPPTAVWRLPADIGRRYAEVSGDRNPIHVSSLAARAFGFPRTVAHGMYTAARALAAMGPRGETLDWDVTFGSAVLVPGTVHLRVERRGEGWSAVVHDPYSGREHLRSTVQPVQSAAVDGP